MAVSGMSLDHLTISQINSVKLVCSFYSGPMDRKSWKAAVHGVPKGWIRLTDFHSLSLFCPIFKTCLKWDCFSLVLCCYVGVSHHHHVTGFLQLPSYLSPWFCSCLFIQSIENTTKRLIWSLCKCKSDAASKFSKDSMFYSEHKPRSLQWSWKSPAPLLFIWFFLWPLSSLLTRLNIPLCSNKPETPYFRAFTKIAFPTGNVPLLRWPHN